MCHKQRQHILEKERAEFTKVLLEVRPNNFDLNYLLYHFIASTEK